MEKNRPTKKDPRLAYLKNKSIQGIGFWESIPLKVVGYFDGRRGLPRKTENGLWLSPHIEKEIRAFDKQSSELFCKLQLEEESAFIRLRELEDIIADTKRRLETATEEWHHARASEGKDCHDRRQGESRLTDEQVVARRARERNKMLLPLKNKVASLQTTLASQTEEQAALHARVIENKNSARLLSAVLRDHLYQRLALYWQKALRKHPERENMPVVPSVNVAFRAEAFYQNTHAKLIEEFNEQNVLHSQKEEVVNV